MGMPAVWTAVKAVALLFTLFYRPRNKSGSTEDSSRSPGDLQIQSSQVGIKIPVILGRRKVAGNLIWYDNFQVHEHYTEQEVQEGGKGGGGGGSTTESVFSHYTYSISFAFGVCMGEAEVFKIYKGEDELPIMQWSDLGITAYKGTTTQTANAHISSFVTRAPAYRNLCYVVFENFDLGQSTYLPNFTFEATVDSDAYYDWLKTASFGSTGSGDGQIDGSTGIDIYENELYVTDPGNLRIQVFSLDGTFRRKWATDVGYVDLSVYEGKVYCLYKSRITSYDLYGNLQATKSITQQIRRSIKAYKDELYTTNAWDSVNSQVNVFDLEGNVVRYFITGRWTTNIDVYNDEVYITRNPDSPIDKEIAVFGLTGGEIRSWEVTNLTGIHIYNGSIYAGTSTPPTVYKYSLTGVLEDSFSCDLTDIYGINRICVDNLGRIFISGGYPGYPYYMFRHTYTYVPPSTIDITPPEIARTILTNDLYGMGIDEDDLGSFTDAVAFCTTNDIKISILLDSEMSTLDLLEHLCSYHNGYITYSGGKLSYKQVETEVSVTNINVSTDVVKSDSPLEMTRESFREVRNRIKVKYTKRANKYTSGIVVAEDEVSQAEHGIQEFSVSMTGFTTGARAMKLAYTILRRSLAMPMHYTFTIGPKKATLLIPGAVFTLTDSQLGMVEKPLRVLSTSEVKEGTINIEAVEEIGYIMDSKSAPSDDYYVSPDRLDDPHNVRYPVLSELPALIALDNNYIISNFADSGTTSWMGATIYDSYDNATYTKKYTGTGSGLMGVIDSITNDSITLTVTDSDTSLNSKDDVFALLQDLNYNACYDSTSGEYFRFGVATLVATGQWKLEGIIWDCYDVPNLTHSASVGDVISLMKYKQLPTNIVYDIARKDNYVYYKFVSYNFGGTPQDIAYVDVERILFTGKGSAPVTPKNLEVNALGGITKIASGDVVLKWKTCNRKDRGLDYTRSDQLTEDTDFVRFDLKITNTDTGVVLRTTNTTDITWTYDAAAQAADGSPTNITFTVEKVSEINRSGAATLEISIV